MSFSIQLKWESAAHILDTVEYVKLRATLLNPVGVPAELFVVQATETGYRFSHLATALDITSYAVWPDEDPPIPGRRYRRAIVEIDCTSAIVARETQQAINAVLKEILTAMKLLDTLQESVTYTYTVNDAGQLTETSE